MLHVIENLLNEDDLAAIDAFMAEAPFAEGAESAGATAKGVKSNQQVDRATAAGIAAIDKIVLGALSNNLVVRAAGLAVRMRPPLYNRYGEGMGYGFHSDNPVLLENPPLRTDLSVTVFLSDPGSYDGGALVVRTENGDAKVKLPRGHAVLYDGHHLHMVEEITKGERLAAVT